MTGKRTNQFAVDPGSPAETDNRDGAHDEHLKDADKGKVQNSMKDARAGDNLIPKGGVNPALAELRARKERDAANARGDHNRGGGMHGGAGAAQRVDSTPDAGGITETPDERAADERAPSERTK